MADLADPTQMFNTDNIAIFIQNNMAIFVLLGIFIVIIYYFVSVQSKQPKIINRGDVEKKKRIDSLRINNNTITEIVNNPDGSQLNSMIKYNNLYHGTRFLGRIRNIGTRIELSGKIKKELENRYNEVKGIQENPNSTLKEIQAADFNYNKIKEELEKHGEIVYEIVYYPALFLNFSNTMKRELLRIYGKSVILDKSKGQIIIRPEISIDSHLGYFYDVTNEPLHLNWINENLFKTDKEDLSAFYFVESQKKSTLDLKNAQEMALKEKELQLELARKRGKMTSI